MNEKTTVAIIGAGPTGLMAACQCIRFGLDFILLDKKEGPTKESRALAIQARTLEVFQQMGIAHEFTSLGYKTKAFNFYVNGKKRATIPIEDIGEGLSEFPYVLVLEQYHTEEIVYGFITQHAKEVSWNTTVSSITESVDTITIAYDKNDTHHQIHCKYLIGADGAKSIVRHYLNTEFHGGTYENIFFVADLEATSKFLKKELGVFLSRKTFAAFFPMQGKNQFRMVGILPEEFKDEHSIAFRDIESSVKEKLNIDVLFHNLNWFSVYRLHHRMAKNFSRGNIFLAGDAAHIHSPVGGQGMNTGLQDANNLVWKLWMIEVHNANKKLLNTYEEERVPFAKRLLHTTDNAFRFVSNANVFTNIFRLHIMPFIMSRVMRLKKMRRFAFLALSQTGFHYKRMSLSQGVAGKNFSGMRFPYFFLLHKGQEINIHEFLREQSFILFSYNMSTKYIKQYDFMIHKEIELNAYNTAALKKAGFSDAFLCLVRPDGYIGFITIEQDKNALDKYLQKTYFS
ncbi:MAG: FAD-dependent monooxygenase [Chitinophagales bacterium]